jgi:hypothetical protein
MDAEQCIAEIEWLERIFVVLDTRPLSTSDISAVNRRHDETLAHSPWFKLWQRYGVCYRPEAEGGLRLKVSDCEYQSERGDQRLH